MNNIGVIIKFYKFTKIGVGMLVMHPEHPDVLHNLKNPTSRVKPFTFKTDSTVYTEEEKKIFGDKVRESKRFWDNIIISGQESCNTMSNAIPAAEEVIIYYSPYVHN